MLFRCACLERDETFLLGGSYNCTPLPASLTSLTAVFVGQLFYNQLRLGWRLQRYHLGGRAAKKEQKQKKEEASEATPQAQPGAFYEDLTEHPGLKPGEECKSRHKKTNFSSSLLVVGEIKRSWDFETKKPRAQPGEFYYKISVSLAFIICE